MVLLIVYGLEEDSGVSDSISRAPLGGREPPLGVPGGRWALYILSERFFGVSKIAHDVRICLPSLCFYLTLTSQNGLA